jgi:alpha-L-fucosidase 2
MKVRLYFFIFLSFSTYHSLAQTSNSSLWYRQPATKWTEALPIGNGRLAAMIFGKTNREQIQLNEETIWAGSKVNDINPSAKSHLKEIQSLLLAEKNKEAYALTKAHLLGTPPEIRSYQTLGDIFIDWQDTSGTVSDYARRLDLTTAVHTTSYKRNGATYELQSFISADADLMIVRIISTGANLHFRISMTREKDAEVSVMHNRIILQGQIMDKGNPEKKGPDFPYPLSVPEV